MTNARSKVAAYLQDARDVIRTHLAAELAEVNGAEATELGFTATVPGLATPKACDLSDTPSLKGLRLPVVRIDDAEVIKGGGTSGVSDSVVAFKVHCYTQTRGGIQTPSSAMSIAWRFASAVEATLESRLAGFRRGYGTVTVTSLRDATREIDTEALQLPHRATLRKIELTVTSNLRLRHSRNRPAT